MTLDMAVKHSLKEDDPAGLEQLVGVPGKAAQIKTILRSMPAIPGGNGLQLLKRVLEETSELQSPRLDLLEMQLSGKQLTELLSLCGDAVKALDLSYNALITANDIPTLVSAAPSMRLLALMNCPAVEGSRLLALPRDQSHQLTSLESILHPALLTLKKPLAFPAAFAFANVAAVMSMWYGPLTCASVPLLTPAQVVQALTDALPWRGVDLSDQRAHAGLAMAQHTLPYVGCAALHAGARAPGTSHRPRTVASVPLLAPGHPRGAQALWAFVLRFSLEPMFARMGSKNGWAFVRLTRHADAPAPVEGPPDDGDALHKLFFPGRFVGPPLSEQYTAEVCDLDGFLVRMAREGRPMPADDAVRELKELLAARYPETDTLLCPFADDLQLSDLS